MPESTEQGYAIQVLERAAVLLKYLATRSSGLNISGSASLKDIAAATGLHASTAHRILNDLAIDHFVERVGTGEYKLGMRLLELGNVVKGRLSVRDCAYDAMQTLHRSTGQTVNLSVRQGDDIMYIERAYSERSGMQVVRAIGGRAPLHLTSVGKLFLAAEDDYALKNYVMRTGLAGHTVNSITEAAKLKKELQKTKIEGCAHDNEELELGVRCMAVGVFDDTRKLVAGLSISAPADRLQASWLETLRTTALGVSRTLGYSL